MSQGPQQGGHCPHIATLLRTMVPTTRCHHFLLVPSLPSSPQPPWPLLPTAGTTWPAAIYRFNPAVVSGLEGAKDISLVPQLTGGQRKKRTYQELECLDFSSDPATTILRFLDISEFSRLYLEIGAMKNICLSTSVEIGRSNSVI